MNFREGICRLALLALAAASVPSAVGQCAIQPIKPIPPIGCKDLTPQCVADNSGHAYWTWACVKDQAPKNHFDDWKPFSPAPKSHPIPMPLPPPAPAVQAAPAIPTTPSPDISWVKIGMSQQEVISGLAGHFKLEKEGDLNETGSQIEIWSVESLSRPAPEFWEIAFAESKVASIITNSLRPLQGEALTLAQRLFAELYPRGDVDNSKAGKFLGTRDLAVQVKMFQMTSATGNEETMRFQFDNGRSFEIKINVPVKGSPAVNITEFQTQ